MKLIKLFIFAILGSQSTFVFAIKDNIFKKPRVVKDLHESLPDKNWFLDQIFLKYSNESSNFISQSDFKEIIQNLNINYHDHDDHDHNGHDHEDHDHYHSLAKSKSENFSICYSSEQILSIFHLHDPTDLIPKNLFQEMSASLIWLGLNSGCHTQDHHNDSNQCETSTLDKYLYGSLSVIIIWVISMICVSLLGKFKDSLKFLILALKGLAIGTLLSDALLHIIPTALGIHSHDHSDDGGHDHSEEIVRDHRDPLWKMTATMTTMFFLWLLETFFHHHHNHDHDSESHSNYENVSPSSSSSQSLSKIEHFTKNDELNIVNIKTNQAKIKNTKSYLKTVHPSGWIALFGDLMHKAADGFAIAAAFSESLSLGFSTSLAILFHEIPHELGDYAILISSGFRHCTVLILNSITSAVSLIAFMILVSVSPDAVFREWIFAVTTGVFLYISLANMIPRVMREFESNNGKPNFKKILLVVAFFLIGWIFMFLLALFEDKIQFIFSISCSN